MLGPLSEKDASSEEHRCALALYRALGRRRAGSERGSDGPEEPPPCAESTDDPWLAEVAARLEADSTTSG